ncbi:Gfo/Idh/MocA family protein [Alkalicoccobacillus porphyridii]|uniref:Gfo/Idh/MocA family oxidoreductase n=1 Tax=Alkalicoccobacillus porphyridii TaxID=2597270 RepID=A0A553ZW74_9BACI|nr:Gfo/Idh/MocA family oxidoreductase [Alkalicoccobacillus porphyridii]TSB45683.1 Gfo/Idh/MocA family oxidoreductase [Alkalicoccobacillus porphyridii]
MSALKMGIVGTGGIARGRHIPAYVQQKDQVELTSVFDQNQEAAKAAADEFNIAHVAKSYEELLKKVDAVTICTPNIFHAELAKQALEAGVHVLCEKPMATSVEDCETMVNAARESGKILMIGYHYRFYRESQAAKKLLSSGEIGDPLVIRVQALRRRKVPGWGVFTNRSLQGGGCLMDYGCHLLDLALWLTDFEDVDQVLGQTYERISRDPEQVNEWGVFDPDKIDVEDHATAYIKFKSGATLLFETSWAANILEDKEVLSISGTQGGIEVFPFSVNTSKHGMLTTSQAQWLPGEKDAGLAQAQNFVRSCLGLEQPRTTAEQAMKTSEIISAIYDSSSPN